MRSEPVSESAQIKIRTNQSLRSDLEKAAEANGISMNSEIIDRLEKSIAAEKLEDANIGPEISGLVLLLSRLAHETSMMAGFNATQTLIGTHRWHTNPYAYDQVVKALNVVLEAFRPDGPVKLPKGPLADLYAVVGEGLAATWLSELATGEAISGGHAELLPALEEKLATMLDRIRGRDFGVDVGTKLPE